MNHPIHFVSLGPGDPELITLKGLIHYKRLILSIVLLHKASMESYLGRRIY